MHRDKDQPSRFSGGLSTEDLAQQPSGTPERTGAEPGTASREAPVFPGESTGTPSPGKAGTATSPQGDRAGRTAGQERSAGTAGTEDTEAAPGTKMPGAAGTAETAGGEDTEEGPEAAEGPDTARTPETTGPAGDGEDAPRLLSTEDEQGFRDRWHETQNKFVDDPREAVHAADTLVADVMQTLAATFARHKEELEGQWSQGEQVDTEELRKALRRYRSFFNRLLST
ncbi:hypothetical protein [Streptomyces sp. NRRL S-340]|uniref:hypothetical protein n=1 Tax=Streptomyces sp. NRRL S-340 TaxID=1463901 RepID=UPI000559E976|nr:hypothetical protein [Streptomyces sp. NRRL S-340]